MFPAAVRVFMATAPIDMRGSFDALAGHARGLGLSPEDGHLYVFVNARGTLMKAVFFDGSGWVLLAKRLERGTFQLPGAAPGQRRVVVDAATLALVLEGYDLRRAPRRLRYRKKTASE